MIEIQPVTLGEAQYLLRRPQEEINRAIDRGLVDKLTTTVTEPAPEKIKKRPRPVRRKPGSRKRASANRAMGGVLPATVKRKVRVVGQPELLFFAIEAKVRDDLTPQGRRKLYDALKMRHPGVNIVEVGPLKLEIALAIKELTGRYKGLEALRKTVTEPLFGDPVIKGTDISVYRVAALADPAEPDPAIIQADYPGLTAKQIARAIDYAFAYPKRGRPYPSTSFKRALGALADSGALDPPEDDDIDGDG